MASAIFRLSIPSAVHPHTRGDDIRTSLKSGGIIGSPPHAWGRLYGPRKDSPRQRFTPTRVGTTLALQECQFSCSVHPHTRGDDVARHQELRGHIGSPPHAWGRRRASLGASRAHRFTPTRVGTAATERTNTLARIGSPPHAWGRRFAVSIGQQLLRFTPTRVGTTALVFSSNSRIAVHPHTRGDDFHITLITPSQDGSPPHAWGRLPYHPDHSKSRRFTPTRVGTTSGKGLSDSWYEVHPHTRGDDCRSAAFNPARIGSPPHAWGRRRREGRWKRGRRFTPTRVGTTV